MVKAAYEMRDRALREKVDVAVLMDISGACGSSVTYLGSRFSPDKRCQRDPGVAGAAMIRAGISVIFQRDDRSLRLLHDLLDASNLLSDELDHWEKDWYQSYFLNQR